MSNKKIKFIIDEVLEFFRKEFKVQNICDVEYVDKKVIINGRYSLDRVL